MLNIDLSQNKRNQPCEYRITDLPGRTKLNGTLETGKINMVSVGGLDSGVYIITITLGAEVFINKLIVAQ
jgi:hypothetical protein